MCCHLTVCVFVFRLIGEEAEIAFCEHKRLNMSTLRMTWEAKVQLKEILVNSGFPEGSWQQHMPDVCEVFADVMSSVSPPIRVSDDSDVHHGGSRQQPGRGGVSADLWLISKCVFSQRKEEDSDYGGTSRPHP